MRDKWMSLSLHFMKNVISFRTTNELHLYFLNLLSARSGGYDEFLRKIKFFEFGGKYIGR